MENRLRDMAIGGVTCVAIYKIWTEIANRYSTQSLALSKNEVLSKRKQYFCAAQSVSYANSDPLMIVRGKGQYLYDDDAREFLDTRNNVCHVGHANERVAAAVSRQVHQVNSNSRYLHPYRVLLAEKLLSTFPGELGRSGKVFFVNSGTEANDLALRLARCHTKAKKTIVVDHAYHGHSCETICISPYKFKYFKSNQSGGKPKWVTMVSCPDEFRGKYTGHDAVDNYIKEVQTACSGEEKIAAFIVESGMSVGGVIMPHVRYFKETFEMVRKTGGVCICDEVQTGFGRVGRSWWAFEQSGVVPDIVTMGKPFGNGMPLAAVVCRESIAESFAAGPEYFNTFGGNPVSCAAGLAVLEEIEAKNLRGNAMLVGDYFMKKLKELRDSKKESVIGMIRGCGLFLGIDFVKPGTSEPGKKIASWLATKLKEKHHILTSLDGPFDNVMVIKPPMVFSKENVDKFISCISMEIDKLGEVDLQNMQHTPT
eukprot:m.85492 g.85492  ORF g.85492 m.85492 type:complete len:482 (-) comp13014_c0_seq7:32-1477(-)